jgi:hypothetical protein
MCRKNDKTAKDRWHILNVETTDAGHRQDSLGRNNVADAYLRIQEMPLLFQPSHGHEGFKGLELWVNLWILVASLDVD